MAMIRPPRETIGFVDDEINREMWCPEPGCFERALVRTGRCQSHSTPEHPATYPKKVLDRLREMLAVEATRRGHIKVLDPFAGTGGIHELAEARVETVGYEIQPEWARAHPDTICGSVLELGQVFPRATFDVIATSPCYGNRMADSHIAVERCRGCGGQGSIQWTDDDGTEHDDGMCPDCQGAGRRDHHRNTYVHKLRESGVEPVDSADNAMVMQWGPRYREFHTAAWDACHHVLRPGGLVLVNVKNHYRTRRKGELAVEQKVVEFHLNDWLVRGYTIEEARRIPTKGLPVGSNADVRTEAELILSLRRPS